MRTRTFRGTRGWAASLGFMLGLVAYAHALRAHDVWLEPTSFRPQQGETVGIDVRAGENFEGESVPRRPQRIARFWFGHGLSQQPVRGLAGVAPAGVVRMAADASGWRLVRYVSLPASIELSSERFEKHLLHEGLGRILELDEWKRQGERPVREVYSRCVAALLALGDEAADLPAAPEDCALTLWPLEPPEGGELLELELKKEGRPIGGAVVRAVRKQSSTVVVEGRTDADGRVALSLSEAGVWLVKAIHMEPAGTEEADWRSWWATLTFELRDR